MTELTQLIDWSKMITPEMREAQKSIHEAEERILSAEYDTIMCDISMLQISGKIDG